MTPDYRYGPWHGGPDPLAEPYDVARALDALGDDVLGGSSPRQALRRMLRRGLPDGRGLDELRRQVRRRREQLRRSGRLDGTLQQVRELLDRALERERASLFPDPSDAARMAESELDALPADTAAAVRELRSYDWRSPEGRADYERIGELLRSEVLDSRFAGLKQALSDASPERLSRMRDMVADLNALLAAEARGEDTTAGFAEFLHRHGEFFPEQPGSLAELVDQLARRAAAQQRLTESLTPAQRQELADLTAGVLGDLGLQSELDQLAANLRALRPDLAWRGRERLTGEQPMGLGEATTALAELADLAELDRALSQDYPGAALSDVDEELVQRALGRQAVDDVAALRRIEQELQRQGYLRRSGDELELTPRAVRRLGATALRRVFDRLSPGRSGQHDQRDAGAAGDLLGSSRPWRYGDEQPLDVVATMRNAIRRSGAGAPIRLAVADFEVLETERRTRAAVALLVDLSYSMALRGTWATAKATALALHSLVTTRFPQDAIELIGFSDYARVLAATELAGLSWDMVQGTNLQHGLVLANRHLARHPQAEPVVLVVTDGEPTAHLARDGQAVFCWPPLPETIELTLAEVQRCTRRGATINMFMLEPDPRLLDFGAEVARRNGGRMFQPRADRLGEYVVSDYLRARRGTRGRGSA